jgi:hypothetical protein
MKNKDNSDAERWRTYQAKVLLESLCLDIEQGEKFEGGGVRLVVESTCSFMQCNKCGHRWEVDMIRQKNGLLRIRAFVPNAIEYRPFYYCPNECNRDFRWRELG